ncbi:unnamed protein product [Alternaria alternata]
MHARAIFLLASAVLPIIAAPMPTSNISPIPTAERRDDSSVSNFFRDLLRRVPVTEALPTKASYVVVDESKRDLDGQEEEEEDIVKRRIGFPKGGSSKRAIGFPGGGSDKRRIGFPKGGSSKRGIGFPAGGSDKRGIGFPAGGSDKRRIGFPKGGSSKRSIGFPAGGSDKRRIGFPKGGSRRRDVADDVDESSR